MATSDVGVCNLALTKLGDDRILALTDPSKAGATMNALFVPMRDALLRRYCWRFALKRALALALVDEPEWGYRYQYQLPADMLQLVQVGDMHVRTGPGQPKLWELESGALLTNMGPPLKLRYVRRVENAGEFDAQFVVALASMLAFEACEALTQSTSKKDAARLDFKEALMEAVRVDAIETLPDMLPWGSWLDSREGGPGALYGDEPPQPYLNGFSLI